MTEHRVPTDDEALLLRGQTPDGRSELQILAQSLAEFRGAALGLAPRPSATLAARLASNEPLPEGEASAIAPRTRRRVLVGRIAAASIAFVMIVSAFGAANALPPAVQVVFDRVVTSVVPADDENSPSVPAVPLQPTSVTDLDDAPSDGVDHAPGAPADRPTPHSTSPGNSGDSNGNNGSNENSGGNGGNGGNSGSGNKGKTNSGDNPGASQGGGKKDE